MNKKIQRNWIIIGLILIVISVFIIPYLLTIIDTNTRTFKWFGFNVVASSSTGFSSMSASGGCSNWGGLITPTEDSSGILKLEASSSFGQCSGNGASASVDIHIPNPKSYKNIFLVLNGYANTGYGGTSNCPSASASISIRQDSGNSVAINSVSASCVGTGGNIQPNNILLNIDGDTITGSNIFLKLVNDNDLIISASVSANAKDNGRSGYAIINLEKIEYQLQLVVPQCQQLLGQLCNLQESKIVSYSTDCERDNLLKQGIYTTSLDQCQSYCQIENGKLCKPDTFSLFTIADYSNVCEKEDLLSQGYQTDLTKCDTIISPPKDNKMIYIVGGSILSLSALGFMFRKKLGRMLK